MDLAGAIRVADSGFARDSLFQLNVLIWASFPQPSAAPVTPVLRNAGYVLWSVEQPLDAGIAELPRLRTSSPQIQPNPVPDAVLHAEEIDTYVLVECKPSSFGVRSDRGAPQARGLIVAGGNLASRLLGLAGAPSAEVCYLVPLDDAHTTDTTLVTLAQEVSGQGFTACATGAIGLSIKPDGAYLGLSSQPEGTAQMPRALIPEQKILAVMAGQDPRPLYVIPWIPDAPDDTDLTALREKVRAQVLAWLGKAAIGDEVILSFDQLLDEVSRGIFRYWRDRNSLHGRVFPTVERLVRLLFGGDARVRVRSTDVSVRLGAENDRDELMEQVRTAALPSKVPEGVQLPLEQEP